MIYKVRSKALYRAIKLLFQSYGLEKSAAQKVSKYLVEADLCGQASHGINRVPLYIGKVEKKEIDVKAKPKITAPTKKSTAPKESPAPKAKDKPKARV